MSVIAFDGKSISADQMASYGNMIIKADKLFQIEPHVIAGFVGEYGTGKRLIDWFTDGAEPDKYPSTPPGMEEGGATLIIYARAIKGEIRADGEPCCMYYVSSYIPLEVLDPCMAWGSGGDLALGAMLQGASSAKAIELANSHCVGCGNGLVTYRLGRKKGA